MMPPPPAPPCWPLYPEPERSGMEAAYRAEHSAYCQEVDRLLYGDICAFVVGIVVAGVVAWLAV